MNRHGRPKILKGSREGNDGNTYYEFSPACRLGVKLAGASLEALLCMAPPACCPCTELGGGGDAGYAALACSVARNWNSGTLCALPGCS